MDKKSLQLYFFIAILLISLGLVFSLLLPFIEVLVLSSIFGVVLSPFHQKIVNELGGKRGLAAFVVVMLFGVVIITPSVFLTIKVFNDTRGIYSELTNPSEINYIQKVTDAIETPVQKYYPAFRINIGSTAGTIAGWLTGHITSILSKVFNIVVGIILIFITLFFFLKDGIKFKKILVDLSPLDDKYDEEIFNKVKNTVNATVKGVILIAIAQGILSGIGLWIFGIPNPALWGTVSAIASLVPGLGTAIVFIPAVLYMYISGNGAFAIGLALWGGLLVGLVDNFLGPYLYSKGSEIHSIIMLFAVLGGISVFGPIGFLFGPLIISLFFALIDIYKNIV